MKDKPSWEAWLSTWPTLTGRKKAQVLESLKECSESPHKSQFAEARVFKTLVMGDDDRESLTEDEKKVPEFRQVGLVSGKMVSLATSLVTGKNCDVVITNGHVVVGVDGEIRSKESEGFFKFHTDFKAGRANEFTKMYIVDTGYLPLGYKGEKNRDDWAILRLEEPVFENCQHIPFTAYEDIGSECSKEGELVTVGTHKGDYEEKKINRSCKMFKPDPNESTDDIEKYSIKHDCDTGMFSSGSPIYCKTPGGDLRLIGVNNAGVTSKLTDKEIDSLYERFGQPGPEADPESHYNLAVSFWGKFGSALAQELRKSEIRSRSR